LGTWVVTLPDELKDLSHDKQQEFFNETKNFLDKRYGKENAVAAIVHYDETTPHLHYGFVPVVYDEKKDRLKVSAKEVLNRKDLQTFHDDLNNHLKEKLPFYEKGILNDQTLPFQNVEEIKKYNETYQEMKQALEQKKAVIRMKNDALEPFEKSLKRINDTEKMFDTIDKNAKKGFGQVVIKSSDFEKLKTQAVENQVLANANEKEMYILKDKNKKLEKDNRMLSTKLDHKTQKNETLTKKNNELTKVKNDGHKFRELVKRDLEKQYNIVDLTEKEVNALSVIKAIDEDIKPKNKEEGKSWLDDLNNGKGTRIEESMLEKALEKAQELYREIIKKVERMMGMNISL
ncbi:plasmid recombination protein, partial [Enterococcus durans]|uniref:plasmid recombination protein n=2 Tax=Enterococcus durans TaxID=53345 RepID=UPI001FB95AC3